MKLFIRVRIAIFPFTTDILALVGKVPVVRIQHVDLGILNTYLAKTSPT